MAADAEIVVDEVPVVDSHAHAWRRWPYRPTVPDPASRGTLAQLVHEMDVAGVAQAVLVCASIGDNARNCDDVTQDATSVRDPAGRQRIHVMADVDCTWHRTHHTAGAADRLRAVADRLAPAGITHYLGETDDGWLTSAEGQAFWRVAAERDLVVSLAAPAAWHASVRAVARRHPTVPFLLHHLGLASAGVPTADQVHEVVRTAECPNVMVKVSGFHYVSARPWDVPFGDTRDLLVRLVDAYSPGRLLWGSDFPAARAHVTYRQSLEIVRHHHGDLLGRDGLARVLGGTAAEVLATRRPTST